MVLVMAVVWILEHIMELISINQTHGHRFLACIMKIGTILPLDLFTRSHSFASTKSIIATLV